jgi:UDP-N-acetylglucosamine 1-carboxyvinyltransferase
MPPAILVRPSGPLSGTTTIAGAKNSVLKLMAASLLAEGRSTLTNVPRIADVTIMGDLLAAMGVGVRHGTDADGAGTVELDVPATCEPVAPYELVERMRASIVVLGPLLARFGWARVSLPGGDDFGPRPIDMHLRGLSEMGATFDLEHGYLEGRCEQLHGADVTFEFPSVGATENVLMAAVAAKGTTVIENAAREPEIVDLCTYLTAMGAELEGVGSSRLVVHGVDPADLRPASHRVVPDRIEAATFLAAVGVAGGELALRGARLDHMEMLARKLADMGMVVTATHDGIWAHSTGELGAVDVSTLPYPGVATDYKPLLIAMLSVASGVGIVTENLFAGRFRYVDELVRLGADIRTDAHHAVVRGVPRLSGAPVRAHDIRAGAALVVAGLVADGETLVTDAHHLDRGYEALVPKLRAIGARVERVDDVDEGLPP